MDQAGKVIKKYKLHYAWIILAAAGVLNVASRADAAAFGVFIDPLVKLFGWSRGEIGLAYSLAFIAGLPAVMAAGWLGDRYGAQRLMLVASFVIAAGTVLMGTISQLWQLYIFYSLFVGSLGHAAFTVLLPVTITRWFHRWVGLATGIYWASLGLGPVVFAPLFRWLIETHGWRWTFFTMGIILGSTLVLFSLLMRSRPEEKGLTAFGAVAAPTAAQPARAASGKSAQGLRAAASRPAVWYLTTCHHLGCVGHSVILAYVVSMATFQGVPGVSAALILSIISGTSIGSRFIFSVLTEFLGGRRLLTIALVCQSAPILLLFWAHDLWAFYAFAVIFGLGYGGEMVGFPIINRQMFGTSAPLASIYSFEMVGASLGMGLGGFLGGWLFDLSGAYTWSIALAAAVGFVALPAALALPRHRRPALAPAGAPSGGTGS